MVKSMIARSRLPMRKWASAIEPIVQWVKLWQICPLPPGALTLLLLFRAGRLV